MQKYSILCIDDNDNNLFTLESLLESISETKVFLANSGTEGLELLLRENIDLVLLDVQMPEMDGFAVAKFIKKNKKTENIPIIFISAVLTSEEFVKLGYRTGAIDYLAKPIDDNQLLNKISFYLKLFQKEKELEYERNRLQKIIDLQDNLVAVISREKIMQVNQSFLEFAGYKSLRGFMKKHNCVCDLFINEEGYLNGDNEKTWIDLALEEQDKNPVAQMMRNGKKCYFVVRINVLDPDTEEFVATFTDITNLQKEHIEVEKEAELDPLTNIYNRRKFDEELKRLFYLSRKYRLELSILMFDIDHFKKVNDTYGHQAGDAVLVELTKRIVPHLRKGDVFARYGGEEFIILLPTSNFSDALKKAHYFNKLIGLHDFETVGKLTISLGVASLNDKDTMQSIVKRADAGLYQAKRSGRNRVEPVELEE